MITVKHSKDWNSQSSRKKPFSSRIKQNNPFLLSILLGTFIGTYLDLYFTGKGVYSFPVRPLPSIFTINILFTLFGLPFLTGIFLHISNKINGLKKSGLILLISLFMAITEKQLESFGFFSHHESWLHIYSFFGYMMYLTLIQYMYRWLK